MIGSPNAGLSPLHLLLPSGEVTIGVQFPAGPRKGKEIREEGSSLRSPNPSSPTSLGQLHNLSECSFSHGATGDYV